MKRPLSVIGIIAASGLVVVLIVGIIGGYLFNWGWTGLGSKTLWDWLQLIFIPAVLTLGAIWYTARQNHDLHITLDNQRETVLQTYLDKMSDLLLHENLHESKVGDDVRNLARARTLTVLPKMDPNRKRSIVLFLAESGLIDRNEWIVDLSFADLSRVNLSQDLKFDSISFVGANLQGANFSGSDLSQVSFEGANLRRANLSRTDLWRADLEDADLTGADLTEANLKSVTGIIVERLKDQVKSLKGATLPNGLIYP